MEGFTWTLALINAGIWTIALFYLWATERGHDAAAKTLKYITHGFTFLAGVWPSDDICQKPFPKPNRVESIIVAIIFWWIAIGLIGLGFYSVLHLYWIMPFAFAIPWYFWRMESRTSIYTRIGSILVKSSIPLGFAIGALIYLSNS
jgi:hypothetical protein